MRALLDPSVLILGAVLVLIAVRQIGSVRLPIWLIMLAGALAALLSGQIAPMDALRAINLDVMLFLFGMFTVGRAMEESGLLLSLAHRLFRRARGTDALVLMLLATAGVLSAALMNDTIAVIGTPLVLHYAARHRLSPKLLLLGLAFAVTTGSVFSPIGNPQNLLVAVNLEMRNPFVQFFLSLGVPTVISLGLCYVALKLAFPREFHADELIHTEEKIRDPLLAGLTKASLAIICALIVVKIVIVSIGVDFDFRLTWIALAAAAPIIAASPKRLEILMRIDWSTLVFFAAMFVLMESVWRSGVIQQLIGDRDVSSVPVVLAVSVIASQLVSNVPFVALYLPLVGGAGLPAAMALAAGSTIAGNLFILGAASNVIIIQAAESGAVARREEDASASPIRSPRGKAVPMRHRETLTFLDFARVGLPLTAAQVLVYWGWLTIVS